jgi:hypothetical protein
MPVHPGRVQINLDGSPQSPPPHEAQDLANPYVKALRAHREELMKASMDLTEMTSDSLAARLATQRHDALATLNPKEVDDQPDLDDYQFSQFRCGPEPCGEGKGAAEINEVLFSQNGCNPDGSYRIGCPHSHTDDDIDQSLYVRVHSARAHPQRSPRNDVLNQLGKEPDTARSVVNPKDLAEGLSCTTLRLHGVPGASATETQAPRPQASSQDEKSDYLHTIGAY